MAEKRGNLYSYDPTTDISIVGGARLPDDEVGPLDTTDDNGNALLTALLDDERLARPLTESFVANVNAYGVLTPILVKRIGETLYVVAGRQRLRAARRVNAERRRRGETELRIDAKLIITQDATRLMGVMITENEGRYNDEYPTKIRKMRNYIERGVHIDDVAITFNVPLSMAKLWLKFDERAAPEVKDAVEGGEMSIGTGLELLRAGDHAAQTIAYHEMGGETNVRKARATAKRTKKPDAVIGVADVRTQRRILQALRDMPHPNASKETLALWSGAEAMLMAILGERDADKRIVDVVDRVRKAMEAKS